MLYSHKTWAKNGAIEMCVEKKSEHFRFFLKKNAEESTAFTVFWPI